MSSQEPVEDSRPYRGRFAPTPSGPLHLGSLLTAVASFVDARAARGVWLLRIDDLDPPRVRPGAESKILRQLDALGLHWDGSVQRQQGRQAVYDQALQALQSTGMLYSCACSRRDRAAEDASTGGCRQNCAVQSMAFQRGRTALRLKAQKSPQTIFDLIQGEYPSEPLRQPPDFIVLRRDGLHAYHLATVVDDAESAISRVFRGSDLLPATLAQTVLQDLLGFPRPHYAHGPLVLAPDGRKLSKSEGDAASIKENPSRLLSFLLKSLQHPPPQALTQAPVTELLDWAICHWQRDRLKHQASFCLNPKELPPQ